MLMGAGIIDLDDSYRFKIFEPKYTSMWRILLSILQKLISNILHQ